MNARKTGALWREDKRGHSSGVKAGAVYLLLLAGGLWHLLGVFQHTMMILAGPVIILLGLALIGEYYRILPRHWRTVFVIWSLFVLIASFIIELIGARTGMIFGKYEYGSVLQPVLKGVPVAIGFAWLGILLASNGVVDLLFRDKQPVWLFRGISIAIAMVLFDILLEQVAISLHYWHWFGTGVSFQNYAAWFVMSLFFVILGFWIQVFPLQPPPLAKHIYLAQILYFGLVLLK